MEKMDKQCMKKNISVGLLAHVDAGKTTLSEQLLYQTGSIGKAGRVDHKDTFLDTHSLEKERGITIFSKQAIFSVGKYQITLVDTPGHVDFSAEMERVLQILDYAILVINGSDGVQSHTKTVWRLLKKYEIPIFLFINKMDQPGNESGALLEELKEKLSEDCICFTAMDESFYEEIALREEELLNRYLEGSMPQEEEISELIMNRKIFPCYFGSALKGDGIKEFLQGIHFFMKAREYGEEFAARVYKIGRDPSGQRLTYLKVTGGKLKVKQVIRGVCERTGEDWEEKADQLRAYTGASYEAKNQAGAGELIAVLGLEKTFAGQGLGKEEGKREHQLQPVLCYSILLPEDVNFHQAYEKLKLLEEEEPGLQIQSLEERKEILCKVMGEIQIQVLQEIVKQRFGMDITFGSGQIVYKETIEEAIEGVGHFEPLRHYAEVHILLEPLPRGAGIRIESSCSEDLLDRNWQRLIMTHLSEIEHRGVLTGAGLTDVKLTLVTGKSHNKHTEGGDFRQATYRAVRHGLRRAKNILLEPVYEFTLEVPMNAVGRAMSDLQRMCAEFTMEQREEASVLTGICPVVTMQEYQKEVLSYTKGLGRLECLMKGYQPCHNADEVIELKQYDPDQDIQNPCGSIFCSHGAGVYVSWEEVEAQMHLPYVFEKEEQNEELSQKVGERREISKVIGTDEIDAILERTSFANRKKDGTYLREGWNKKKKDQSISSVTRVYQGQKKKEPYVLVDGYNIIFAWQELKELAQVNLDGARGRLQDILCDYQAMKGCSLMVVFDAYRLEGHPVEVIDYHNIKVVYTKEAQTADQYIEKFAARYAKEYEITVATSDGLEQIIIRGQGCHLLSAKDFLEEIKRKKEIFQELHMKESLGEKIYIKDIIPKIDT